MITIEDVLEEENFLAWHFQTDAEKANAWLIWLSQNLEAKEVVQETIEYLNSIQLQENELPAQQVENAYQSLLNKIEKTQSAPVRKMNNSSFRWWIPAAAIILLLAGYAFWNNDNSKKNIESNYGQISQYKLPDGTEVLLNANSQLTLHEDWKDNQDREVWVKGEAFFHVQKTAAKNKFVVHASDMDIIVTGTQFNVINTEKETSILLTEGSVIVKTKGGKEIKMQPGDYVSLDKKIPALKEAEAEKILAWKQKKLIFENTPMNEIAQIINRHYGIKVILSGNGVGEKTVSGMMSNDNLDVLLKALEESQNLIITKTEKEIIISNPLLN
jgi:ferric-dicitrate binding protein FerR (iron transport regulator)